MKQQLNEGLRFNPTQFQFKVLNHNIKTSDMINNLGRYITNANNQEARDFKKTLQTWLHDDWKAVIAYNPNEIIPLSEFDENLKKLNSLIENIVKKVLAESIDKNQIKRFVSNINKNEFFKNIGGVEEFKDGNKTVYSPKKGDTYVYLEIGHQIEKSNFADYYDSQNQSSQDKINELIVDELNKQFNIEW